MNPRFSKLIFALLIVLSIGLAGVWLRAHAAQNGLLASIATARADLVAAARQTTDEQNHSAALASDIDEKQTALAHAPGALEAMRRASALVVINQLKLAHEKNPPAPRQKQPPVPQNGSLNELLSDPEYNQLYAQQERRMTKLTQDPNLRKLGLSAEACEKAISILAEQAMALADYRQLTGSAGIKDDFYKHQTEATNNQLQELMGEETFQRWKAINATNTIFIPNATGSGGQSYAIESHEALVAEANSYLMPKLAIRLSYSDAPLQKQQADQLAELLANKVTKPRDNIFQIMSTDSFIEQAGQVLSPVQVDALRQFQAEQQATTKRGKLPKSSELPRNVQTTK